MMTDIAQRLLDFENEGITSSDRYHLRSEAAAEIARLRAALNAIANWRDEDDEWDGRDQFRTIRQMARDMRLDQQRTSND